VIDDQWPCEQVAIDVNCAAHYGVMGSKTPDGHLKQQAYPFRKPQKKWPLQATDVVQAPVAVRTPGHFDLARRDIPKNLVPPR
jgi:hypothetical protein